MTSTTEQPMQPIAATETLTANGQADDILRVNGERVGSGDRTIRRAGVIAGLGLLVMTVLSVYGYLIVIGGLVVDGDAAKTASNIAEAEGRFRIAVACSVLVVVLDVVVAWALRVLFAPVSEIISGLAAAARIAYSAVLLVATGHLVIASQLLTGPEGGAGFTTPELQAQVLLQIDAFNAMWQLGLVLFGFHLLLLAYLVIRSSYVPTLLGILLAAAGCGYLVDSFATILVRDYSAEVAAFTGVGEAFLMLWLLARGRRIRLEDPRRQFPADGGTP